MFFKPNASVNLLAQQFSEMQMLASSSPSNFVLQRQKLESETGAISKPGIRWIYNPRLEKACSNRDATLLSRLCRAEFLTSTRTWGQREPS